MKKVNINIQENVSLAPLTTFGIGGQARFFVKVKSSKEIIEAVTWAKEKKLPFKVFGGGTNTLFSDQDFAGLVIRVFGGQTEIRGNKITADAGVLLTDLVKRSIALGLSGLEKLTWIPGTIGGAVVGNAGAYGQNIGQAVKKVEILAGQKRCWLEKNRCSFSYRESIFKKKPYLILRVVLKLKPGNTGALQKTSEKISIERKRKFGTTPRCPGCFFKNVLAKDIRPENLALIDPNKIVEGKVPTGWLLEQVGAKGMKVGDIVVAAFHANFLVNQGRGTTAEVLKLAKILKEKVKQKFGILLEEEVRYLQFSNLKR